MNDYENNNFNDNNENRSSYSYSYPDTSKSSSYESTVNPVEPETKKKKGVFTRVIAFAVCAAVISAGSISAYRFIDNDFSFKNFFGSSTSESSQDDTSSSSSTLAASNAANKNDAEQKSLIQLASRTDSMSLPDAVDKVMPAVVGISSQFSVPAQNYSTDWFFGMPFGGSNDGQTQQKTATATGTGIVMTSDGYIITNAHVIYDTEPDTNYGKAQSVSVLMSDKTNYDASIIGYDTDTDIAVLKIDASGLKSAEFGNSDDLKVGELVLAIGNPLGFELFGSVTSGIVSALNRDISVNDKQMSLIQTDAPINNGNSGGPLVNSYGQVVGINSAKMSSTYTSATVEGLGFAIPIVQAKAIIDDLINYGYVKGRAQLGLTSIQIDESTSNLYGIPVGLYVRSVTPNGAADLAGITAGDVIIGVDNEAVSTTDKLKEIITKHKAGEQITVKINRNGKDLDINVTLQEITKGDTLFGDKEVQAN